MPQTIAKFQNFVEEYARGDGLVVIHLQYIIEALEVANPSKMVEIMMNTKGGRWGGTLLHYAAVHGHTKLIKAVLNNLTKVQRFNLLSTENDNLTNVLQEAAGNSRVKASRYLLDSVDHIMSVHLIKHKTSFNYTTIHSFSANGIYNATVLEILFNHYPEAKFLLFEQAQDGSATLHESVYYQEISSV